MIMISAVKNSQNAGFQAERSESVNLEKKMIKSFPPLKMSVINVISTFNYTCTLVLKEIHFFEFGVGNGTAEVQ